MNQNCSEPEGVCMWSCDEHNDCLNGQICHTGETRFHQFAVWGSEYCRLIRKFNRDPIIKDVYTSIIHA